MDSPSSIPRTHITKPDAIACIYNPKHSCSEMGDGNRWITQKLWARKPRVCTVAETRRVYPSKVKGKNKFFNTHIHRHTYNNTLIFKNKTHKTKCKMVVKSLDSEGNHYDIRQRVQISNYKISSWASMCMMLTIVNNTINLKFNKKTGLHNY